MLREEHRMMTSENRVLRKIFGPQRENLNGDWRKLDKEDLYDLHSSTNIIWVIK
jgi:hypothetical protein